jgi:hypothetical protein
MATPGLSKTKLLSGLQCPKRLYLQVHRPDEAETGGETERLIQFGYRVQEVARELHPAGELIGHETAVGEAVRRTGKLLRGSGDRLLFEAAFRHAGVAARADLLSRRRGRYRLNEVKGSTQVKDYHYNDVAIQRWVIEGAGYPLKSTVVSHIDNQFVYPGEGDYRGLFREVDVTDEIESLQKQVPAWIRELRGVLAGPEPEIEMGAQYHDPFECEFQAYCRRGLPPQLEYPVTLLPRGGKTVQRLLDAGYADLRKVPEAELKTIKHKRVWRITRTGKAELDP